MNGPINELIPVKYPMTKIQTVLFDVDGTLLDTTEFILQAYEYTLKQFNYLKPDFRKNMITLFGAPLTECYKVLAPDGNNQELCVVHDTWQNENLHLVQPFPSVIETVEALQKKGSRIGAVTNRLRGSATTILGYSAVDKAMEVIIGVEDVINPKPHPEGILKAMEIMKVKPEETMMVGDSEFDILAGKEAGVITVGVRTGLHPEAMEAAKPDYVINRMSELIELLDK